MPDNAAAESEILTPCEIKNGNKTSISGIKIKSVLINDNSSHSKETILASINDYQIYYQFTRNAKSYWMCHQNVI